MKKFTNIIVIETSSIICEGLEGLLLKNGLRGNLHFAASLEEVELLLIRNDIDIVIVNPLFLANNTKLFNALKCQFINVKWIGLIYTYFDPKILSLPDYNISISDSPETIINIINKLQTEDDQTEIGTSSDILSEREIEVLKLLAAGLANKEIADKLNISTNTVITHRKNISQKTGIKSVSGLTIYAVVQKLITLESI